MHTCVLNFESLIAITLVRVTSDMHVATLIYLLVVQHTAVVWSLEVFWQNFLTLIIALMTTDQ